MLTCDESVNPELSIDSSGSTQSNAEGGDKRQKSHILFVGTNKTDYFAGPQFLIVLPPLSWTA